MQRRSPAVRAHRHLTAARALLLVLPLVAGPGCSYAFVHGPRTPSVSSSETADAEGIAQTCTRSNALPILDTTLGAVLGAIGVAGVVGGVAAATESPHPARAPFEFNFAPTSGDVAAFIGVSAAVIAVGGVLLGSGVSGFGRTEDCRRAIERSFPQKLPPPTARTPAVSASP